MVSILRKRIVDPLQGDVKERLPKSALEKVKTALILRLGRKPSLLRMQDVGNTYLEEHFR